MTLFGHEVPGAAVRVEVRPIFRQGNTLPLYDGTCQDLTEGDILLAASKNVGFWEYVDAQVRAGRIQTPKDNLWSWQVRVRFFDQAGNASDSLKSENLHEFYRGTWSAGGVVSQDGGAAAMLAAANMAIRDITSAATQAIGHVSQSAAQLMQAAAAPTTKLVEVLAERARLDVENQAIALETIGGLNVELRQKPVAVPVPGSGNGALDVLKFVGEVKSLLKN